MFTKICVFLLILTIPTCSIADILYLRSSKKRTCKIVSVSDSTFVIRGKKRGYDKRRQKDLEEIRADEILAYKYSHGILTPVTLKTSVDSLAFHALVEQGKPKIIEQKVSFLDVMMIVLLVSLMSPVIIIHSD